MAHWKWDSSFSLEIADIDDQHKRIIDYINELHFAGTYRDFGQMQSILLALIDYTQSHFSFEEYLMHEARYSQISAHKEIHNAFINRINFFIERFDSGENIGKELSLELQIWLINHIQHDDAEYKSIVQSMLKQKQIAPTEKDRWLKRLTHKFFNAVSNDESKKT